MQLPACRCSAASKADSATCSSNGALEPNTTKATLQRCSVAFENYSTDPNLLKQQRLNARNMAEALFDREKIYAELAAFILANDSADTQ
jgi:hypothetical protein